MKISFDWKAPVAIPFVRSNFPVGSWAKFGNIIYIIHSWHTTNPEGHAIMINSENGTIRYTEIMESAALTGTKITAPSEINFSW